MPWTLRVMAGLCILVGAGMASAHEQKAERAPETVARVVLADGTKLCAVDAPLVAPLQEGVTVMLTYEVRNGQQVVNRIETAE